MPDAYSIRESLQGALVEFIRGSGCRDVDIEELVREVVGLLASYREEGVALFPQIFIFLDGTALRALATAGEITIGHAAVSGDAAMKIIKDCAPLAAGGWSIFAIREESSIRYGVFRSQSHSIAIPAEEAMHDLGAEVPVILIRNRGHLIVELRSSTRKQFTVALTTMPAQNSSIEIPVSHFAEAATSSLSECEDFKAYLRRVIAEALQQSHGTLLAVIESDGTSGSRDTSLADGVWLGEPIYLNRLYRDAASTGSADSLSHLVAAETLLRGMINCDGVVAFGTIGEILGYRIFLKPRDQEALQLPEVGGGRRRTFALMKLRIPSVFRAALIRSQDGVTDCMRCENAQ